MEAEQAELVSRHLVVKRVAAPHESVYRSQKRVHHLQIAGVGPLLRLELLFGYLVQHTLSVELDPRSDDADQYASDGSSGGHENMKEDLFRRETSLNYGIGALFALEALQVFCDLGRIE